MNNLVYAKNPQGAYESLTSNSAGHLLVYDSAVKEAVENLNVGSGSDLKARHTISDASSSTFLNCTTDGHLEVNIMGRDNAGDGSIHNCKVNDNGELFTQLRPTHFTTLPTLTNGQGHGLIFDQKARLLTKSTLSGLTDINDETSTKNIKVDSSGAVKIDDINSSQLRKTFTEGQDPSIDLGNGANITTGFTIMGGCDNVNSNFDQINPIRVDTDGKQNIIATTGDISDLRNVSNGKSVATLSNEINDKLTDGTQKAKVMGNSGGSQTQMLVDPAGNVNTMPRAPNRANIQISSSVISTWNNDVSCDLIAMENYSCATIHIIFSNSSMTEDGAFVVEGTDDDSNFYPLAILRPRNGYLRNGVNTSDFIKESIYIPYAKFRIINKSGSNQPLLNSDGAFYSIHDNSSDNFSKDNEGALLTAGNIVRGSVPSIPSPWGSATTTGSIDVGHHKTLNFYLGGIINTHSGIIVQGSNDNSNFVKLKLSTPSTVATEHAVRDSVNSGYRYYRFENAGNSITTAGNLYTFNHYD